VRANLARAVLGSLTAIATIAALGSVMAVASSAATTVAVAAAELALSRFGSVDRGVSQIRSVDDGCRGLNSF
jgi:hypothetical protein